MPCVLQRLEEKPCRDSGPKPWSYPPEKTCNRNTKRKMSRGKQGWGPGAKQVDPKWSKEMDRNGRLRLPTMSWYLEAHAEEDQSELPWTVVNCRELSWTVVSSLNLLDARNQKCCFETVSSSLDLCKRFSCALWCTMMHYAWLLPSRSKNCRACGAVGQTITLDIFGSVKHLWSCAETILYDRRQRDFKICWRHERNMTNMLTTCFFPQRHLGWFWHILAMEKWFVFFWRRNGGVTLWGSLGKALDVVLDRLDPAILVFWIWTVQQKHVKNHNNNHGGVLSHLGLPRVPLNIHHLLHLLRWIFNQFSHEFSHKNSPIILRGSPKKDFEKSHMSH